jgi:hypothetical protein
MSSGHRIASPLKRGSCPVVIGEHIAYIHSDSTTDIVKVEEIGGDVVASKPVDGLERMRAGGNIIVLVFEAHAIIWNWVTNTEHQPFIDFAVHSAVVSYSGNRVLFTGDGVDEYCILDADTEYAKPVFISHAFLGKRLKTPQLSAAGRWIFPGSVDPVTVYDTSTDTETNIRNLPGNAVAPHINFIWAFHQEEDNVAAYLPELFHVRRLRIVVLDLQSKVITRCIEFPICANPCHLAGFYYDHGRNSSRVVVCTFSNKLYIVDVTRQRGLIVNEPSRHELFGISRVHGREGVFRVPGERRMRVSMCTTMPLEPWSDRTHRWFGPRTHAIVRLLMLVRRRLKNTRGLPAIPMEFWLEFMKCLVSVNEKTFTCTLVCGK